ncbi:hypothetical protein HQ571_02015 [Candidatus Kuenenbacteria bacterium]|nr:hypothetical protein [Candidatus Kuenenbacteria bacterium]
MNATEKPEITEQEVQKQFDELLLKLAGNQSFARIRGKLMEAEKGLSAMIDAGASPSEFRRNWDQYSKDVRVIGNLLAKFRKNGKEHAAEELTKALRSPGYTLPGEDYPFDDNITFTVVIFEMERVMTLVKYLVLDHTGVTEIGSSLDGVPADLVEAFPFFEGYKRDSSNPDYIYGDFRQALSDMNWPLAEKLPERSIKLRLSMSVCDSRRWDDLSMEGSGIDFCGYIVRQTETSEIMKRFPRDVQDRLGLWRFEIPRVLYDRWKENQRMFSLCFASPKVRLFDKSRGGILKSTSSSFGYDVAIVHRDFPSFDYDTFNGIDGLSAMRFYPQAGWWFRIADEF